jgi:hypothetical protein
MAPWRQAEQLAALEGAQRCLVWHLEVGFGAQQRAIGQRTRQAPLPRPVGCWGRPAIGGLASGALRVPSSRGSQGTCIGSSVIS